MLKQNMSTKGILLLALAGIGLLLLVFQPDKTPELRETAVPAVAVAEVEVRDLVPVETVTGRLEPARKAWLHFELAGQVSGRQVEPGQSVAAGDLMLSLAEGDYSDALEAAEARLAVEKRNIQRDRELLSLARRNRLLQREEVTRFERLGEDSLISRSRLDEARIALLSLSSEVSRISADVESAEARLALLQAERNRAGRNLQRTRLTAPFDANVNSVKVQSGDYVTPSQPVIELVDIFELDLYAEVRGEVAHALAQGQLAEVIVNGRVVTGTIIALQLDPDPMTFTHALRVRLPGEGIRPGQVARVQLALQPLGSATVIPGTAVLYDEGQTFVFRVIDGRLHKTEVVTGYRQDDLQVISRGLAANDQVVVQGVAALTDGQQVQVSEVHPMSGKVMSGKAAAEINIPGQDTKEN